MALASSTQPLLASLHNKDTSILDDDIFNQFIDADEFDFSDSSYDRSTQADVSDRDSWFDEPYTGITDDLTGHLPSLSPFESGDKTFVLDEQETAATVDPQLDAQEGVGLRTPSRADTGIRKIPSTVKTARRSQSYGVRKSPHRRADSSPTMPQQSSRRTNKDGKRHRDAKGLQSPPSSHFDPLSSTVTQSRYADPNQTAQSHSRYRDPSFASQVSPLSQQFPSQLQTTMPYYTPLASPQFHTGQTTAYNQPQPLNSFFPSIDLDIDQYLVAAPPPSSTLNPPNFSNPFPLEADMAWEHDLGSLPNDFGFPSHSHVSSAGMSSPTHSNIPLFNDSKVQSWAPPLYPSAPHTAPLMSTQQQYYDYGSAAAFPTHHYQPLQSYQNQPVPHSAHPASNGFAFHAFPTTHGQAYTTHDPIGMSGMSFINHTHTQPPLQLLSVPKTRRDRTRTHTPEAPDSRRSQSRPASCAASVARPSSKARSKGKARAKSRSRAHSSSGSDSEDSLSDDALMAHYDDIGGSDEDDDGDASESDAAHRRRRRDRDADTRKDRDKVKSKSKSTRSVTAGPSSLSFKAAPSEPRSPSHARSRSQARHTSRYAPTHTSRRRQPSSTDMSPISPVSPLPKPPRKPRAKSTKSKSKAGNDPFVNLTAEDHKKILTGVAPSGGSKTKAKREREEIERREELERRLRSLGA